ncbi:MAG: hypothetical protein H7Z12_15635 [Rhodospirillaceae bacterium]|nr:hypothetical protein [Rhodospirillales bacterium]
MQRPEPIAIIGMSCRYPGGAESPAELWRVVSSGLDATSDIPRQRFDVDAWADTGSGRGIITRRGGFIASDIRAFDAGFFGIPPAEAEIMDPQFRLLLELGYEALEDAGQDLGRLSGGDHGVYVGVCFSEYRERLLAEPGGRPMDSFLICGTTSCSASGRLSYHFGFEGPSLTLDAACSSSLLTVHQACRDLRAGEIDLALAGGVNLLLSPETFVAFSRLQVLSPDGRCKAFDVRADGYGRAEGAGLACLKRLTDAERDGDRILAVIEGTGLTNDGAAKSYTAPRPAAQAKAIRKAMADAGITADDIDVLEAHGTGTRLGDRVEIEALGTVYADRSPSLPPIRLGAVKANIGHAESAAGIASLIKMVLALRAGALPPHIYGPNSNIDWPVSLQLDTGGGAWPASDRIRRAGINSFGMSGVNVHLILAEHRPTAAAAPLAPHLPFLLTISAQSAESLAALGRAWVERLKGASDAEAALLVASQAHRRSTLRHRLTAVGNCAAELRACLALRVMDMETEAAPDCGVAPPVAFVRSGSDEAGIETQLRQWGITPCAVASRTEGQGDDALAAELAKAGARLIVEISPQGFAARRMEIHGDDGETQILPWISALAPQVSAPLALPAGLGRMHEHGLTLPLTVLPPNPGAAWIDPPAMPWSRQVFWVERAADVPKPQFPVQPDVPAHPTAPATDPLDQVRTALAAVLGVAPAGIDVDTPMAKLGLDSLLSINLANRLGALDTSVSPTVFWNHPTVRKLAKHLSAAPVNDTVLAPTPAPLVALEAELDDILERLG